MKYFTIALVIFFIFSCSSENGLKPELTNPEVQLEDTGETTQRDRTWDVHVRDSDNWDIYLNSSAHYSDYKYTGILEWTIFGTLYTGEAWGYYDSFTDIFTLNCIDGYRDEQLSYSFVFESDDDMYGYYFYKTSTYASSITGVIMSGNIGSHGQPTNRNTSSHEFSVKAQRIEE